MTSPTHSVGDSFGADWCADDWCYVDPDDCDLPTYPSTYFDTTLYFAYASCDTTFCGNDWVGQGVECAGVSGCPCTAKNGTTMVTFAFDPAAQGHFSSNVSFAELSAGVGA